MEGPSIGACVGTELGSSQYFTDWTAYRKLGGLLLGGLLGLLYVLILGTDVVTGLGFWYGRVIGTTLGSFARTYVCA